MDYIYEFTAVYTHCTTEKIKDKKGQSDVCLSQIRCCFFMSELLYLGTEIINVDVHMSVDFLKEMVANQ